MDDNAPIPIACTHCHTQIAKTYKTLRDSPQLECQACGHKMASERAAVLHHLDTISLALAAFTGRGAARRVVGSSD
jgi:DNA-directed RNA polymerase subunit RPC12/RpoP